MKRKTMKRNTKKGNTIKLYIKKYKYTILLAVALVLVLFFMIKDNEAENQSIKIYGVDQRVDISHTYKKLNEGVHKAYPGSISLMSYAQEGLRIECISGSIINVNVDLPVIDDDYEKISATSEIYLMDVSSEVEIKVDGQDVSIAKLISKWKEIRSETDETPSKLGKSLIQFKTDNEKVIAIHLNTK